MYCIEESAVALLGLFGARGIVPMCGGTFFKGGGTSARQKTIENSCGLNWQL